MPVMPQKRRRLADRAAGVGAGRRGQRGARRPPRREPPEEPPGTRLSSQGLRTGPKAEFSLDEPIANSSQLSLPSVTVPAARQARDHGGVERAAVAVEHLRAARWSRRPAVTKMSLCAIGHAEQRRRPRRAAMRVVGRARLRRACASASTARNAPSRSCCAPMRVEAVPRRPRRWRRSLRRAAPRPSCARRVELVQRALIRSPSARGTARRSTAGALRWLASRWSVSVTTSSRRRS